MKLLTKKLLELSLKDKMSGIYISDNHYLYLFNEFRPKNFTGKFLQYDYKDRVVRESYFKNGWLEGKDIFYSYDKNMVTMQEYKKGKMNGDFKKIIDSKLIKHFIYKDNKLVKVIKNE